MKVAITPGRFHAERENRGFVLSAKAATFVEQERIADLPEDPAEGGAGVAAGPGKNNSSKENIHEGRICSTG